jgi:hypothetical protein
MWALSDNPIHCIRCNLELEPSSIPLPLGTVEPVAHWCWVAGAVYILELDSGPYEQWAQAQLLDLTSPVNAEGLSVRQDLDRVRRCYYVLFQPMGAGGAFVVPDVCPSCGGPFEEYPNGRLTRLLCQRCSLALVNP